MKNLLIILSLLLSMFLISASAQAQDKVLQKGTSFETYTGVDADTLSADETWSYSVLSYSDYGKFHNVKVNLDSISGTPTCDIKLQGKVFSDDSWTDIETVSWAGTTSDTTFTFSEASTAKYYRYYKVLIDTDATEQSLSIGYIYFKLWFKD